MGNNQEAVDKCNDAYFGNYKANNYFCNWAIALLNLKMYSEGVDAIIKAVETDKKNPRNWIVWAELMKAKGEFDAVKEKLEIAHQLDSKNKYVESELVKVRELLKAEKNDKLDDAIMELVATKGGKPNSKDRNCNCIVI